MSTYRRRTGQPWLYWFVYFIITWTCALTTLIAFINIKSAGVWEHFALGWTCGAAVSLGILRIIDAVRS